MKRVFTLLLLLAFVWPATISDAQFLQHRRKAFQESGGPPTFFGFVSNPADNVNGSASPTDVTPPASMVAGDGVLLIGVYRGSATIAVAVDGGQSWTEISSQASATASIKVYLATYDGTWDANPSLSTTLTANGFNVMMMVFRPYATPHTWAVDVAESDGTFTAPADPFDVTITGFNTTADNAVAFFLWTSTDDNTWAIQSGGSVHPTGVNQVRNTTGSDVSTSITYEIVATAGATGDQVNSQETLGGDAGVTTKFSIK